MSWRSRTLLVNEAALWLVTAAAIVGMHRLFVDGSYRPMLLVEAVIAHMTVALLRRRGVRLVPAAAVTAVAGVLVLTWAHYAATTMLLLPGGETWSAAGDDLRAAWQLFHDEEAPVPVHTGFLLVGGAALWLMVFVADWAAFRARATFEALLPSATLFLFAAALGAPGGRVPGATLYAATAMLFVLLQRTLDQEHASTWAASHRSRGRWSLLGTGATLIAITVVAGAVTGPNLPGAGAEAVLGWRDINDEDETRVVISPMVDLQTRLVEQPDAEAFTVRSPRESYWRLTSLDEFDGQIWRSSYGTNDADGSLPRQFESSVSAATVDQTFTVQGLGAVWLPAAWEPVSIDPGDNDVDWDEASSTLIVDRSLQTSDGFSYEVSSQVPDWTYEDLRRASAEVPEDVAERYLRLPEINDAVGDLASDLTADVSTPYDKALALQNYLRGSQFQYNLEAQRGHSSDALTTFLFDTREGYCEQFAGAFAVMARSIGLPTRVTVGFTPGTPDAEDPTLYHVRGEDAHAWPEVYLDGFGWVIVDPTPTRAPPGAENWLGISPGQDTAPGGDVAGTPGAADAGSGQPSSPPPGGASGDEQRGSPDPSRNQTENLADDEDDTGVSRSMRIAALVVALGALAYLLLVPAAIGTQRALRHRRAQRPADRVRLAWRDAIDRAAAAGTPLPPSLTVTEAAERLTAAVPGAAVAVHQIAAAMEHITYAEVVPSADEAERVMAARDAIVDEVRRREPLVGRVARFLDVRELWRRRDVRARRSARSRPRPVPAVGP
jgi:transglutaminase-like putative cysteine protease